LPRTGESTRFQIRHFEVRILPPQPAIPALGRAPEETPEWAGNPGFSRIRFRLWTPALPDMRWKTPKVSVHFREYSRFGETFGGDGFDQDCRPRNNAIQYARPLIDGPSKNRIGPMKSLAGRCPHVSDIPLTVRLFSFGLQVESPSDNLDPLACIRWRFFHAYHESKDQKLSVTGALRYRISRRPQYPRWTAFPAVSFVYSAVAPSSSRCYLGKISARKV
jgi:hypothetical protein